MVVPSLTCISFWQLLRRRGVRSQSTVCAPNHFKNRFAVVCKFNFHSTANKTAKPLHLQCNVCVHLNLVWQTNDINIARDSERGLGVARSQSCGGGGGTPFFGICFCAILGSDYILFCGSKEIYVHSRCLIFKLAHRRWSTFWERNRRWSEICINWNAAPRDQPPVQCNAICLVSNNLFRRAASV